MARHARKASSSGYYHAMVRGINKEQVFCTDQHKRVFLKYIKEYLELEEIQIVAWCIMNNHSHFVIKTELTELSKFIKVILLRFANYYNKFSDRIGPVFGDRFRSEVIEDDNSLKHVVRYVHLNPVKAGITRHARDYLFSSFNEYIDEIKYITEKQKSFYLSYFNNNISRYTNFHEQTEYPDHFIDTREDKDIKYSKEFTNVIHDFLLEYNLKSIQEVTSNSALLEELLKKLTQKTEYTLKHISEKLNIDKNRVYYISKKIKQKAKSSL